MPRQLGDRRRQATPKLFRRRVVQHGRRPVNSGYGFQIGPKRTLKFTLCKLMGMRAASCVCELRPAL